MTMPAPNAPMTPAPLTVSPEMLEKMQVATYLDFETRVLRHLRIHHADEVTLRSDEALRGDIRHAVQIADGYGLRREYPVVLIVLLELLLGRDFDLRPRHARVVAFLRDRSRSETERAEIAYDWAVANLNQTNE